MKRSSECAPDIVNGLRQGESASGRGSMDIMLEFVSIIIIINVGVSGFRMRESEMHEHMTKYLMFITKPGFRSHLPDRDLLEDPIFILLIKQLIMNMSIIITEQKKVTPMKCHRCGHLWNYGGKNEWIATCPHCHTMLSIKKHKIPQPVQNSSPVQAEERNNPSKEIPDAK
jgi:hypothetical protein